MGRRKEKGTGVTEKVPVKRYTPVTFLPWKGLFFLTQDRSYKVGITEDPLLLVEG